MPNIPGILGYIQPQVISRVRTLSKAVSIPGGLRVLGIVGEGLKEEVLVDKKIYHTVYELKNGLGPAPIKTTQGWMHMAHGVRNTAAGLRYVLYLFMTDLKDLTKVTHKPAGYFMAPEGIERVGDVSNVLFCNGWIKNEDGTIHIYYASSDTRMHVATTTEDQLVDYLINNPEDGLRSAASVTTITNIIEKNKEHQPSQTAKHSSLL